MNIFKFILTCLVCSTPLLGEEVSFRSHNVNLTNYTHYEVIPEHEETLHDKGSAGPDVFSGILNGPFSLKESVNSFAKNLAPFYLPDPYDERVSGQCRKDVLLIYSAFAQPETLVRRRWALKMLDSWGKSEDGILQGNRKLLGFFQECISVQTTETNRNNFHGQYCLLSYSKNDTNPYLRNPLPHITVRYGFQVVFGYYSTCIPSSCTTQDLIVSIDSALSEYELKLEDTYCQIEDKSEDSYDASEIFGLVFFSILLIVLVVATLVDIATDYPDKQHLRDGIFCWLLAFSIRLNLLKLFKLDYRPAENVISCLHEIRALSIAWIVLCHVYFYSTYVSSNLYAERKVTDDFAFQIVLNGYKGVDTFLFLSGFLVTYALFHTLDKRNKFPAAIYIIHRIVRLAPPIAIFDCFLATLSSFFVVGPFAPIFKQFYVEGCRTSWWVDVTFINNFYYRWGLESPQKSDEGATCCLHCWYTAIDTQLYIFMPIVLLPLFFWKRTGVIWLSLWVVVSVIIPGLIIGLHQLYPMGLISFNSAASVAYAQQIYMMPYCRAGTYLMGTCTAYILHKYSKTTIPKLNKIVVAIGWSLSMLVIFGLVFGMYPFNRVNYTNPADDVGTALSVFYGSFQGPLWGMCLGWIVLACHWGYGGMVNTFLSHPLLQPVSRLTFCIFLVHLPLLFALLYSTIRPTYFNHVNKISETCGLLFMSMIGATLLNLVSESPALRIEKLIMKRFK